MSDTLRESIDQAREIAEALNRAIENAERQRDHELARRLAAGEDVETFDAIGADDLAGLRAAKLAKFAADDAFVTIELLPRRGRPGPSSRGGNCRRSRDQTRSALRVLRGSTGRFTNAEQEDRRSR